MQEKPNYKKGFLKTLFSKLFNRKNWKFTLIGFFVVAGIFYFKCIYEFDYYIPSFRGIDLGSPIIDNRDLVKSGLSSNLPIVIYQKQREELYIGDLRLKSIYYDYFQNRLYRIRIIFNESVRKESVTSMLKEIIGNNRRDYWQNDSTVLELYTFINRSNFYSKHQVIEYRSKLIDKEVNGVIKENRSINFK